MPTFDCTVIGDIFADLIISVNGNSSEIFQGGTTYSDFAELKLGGSGNVAIGLSTLGGRAVLVGKAGDDLFGKLYVMDLKENKVIPRLFLEKNLPTGLVVVFLDSKKERSFLVFRGANDNLSRSEIDKVADEIKRSEFVYFSGYSLFNDPQRTAVLYGIEMAKKNKKKIVFDPGAHNLIRSKRNLFAKLLNLCDVFSPNLDEAFAITNARNIEDLVNKLRNRAPLTALKCGKNGCILINEKNYITVPSFEANPLDTTGAGDAFTAALIYGFTRDLSLEATGKLANWFAAQVITRIGPRSFPTKSRIDHFFEKLTMELMHRK